MKRMQKFYAVCFIFILLLGVNLGMDSESRAQIAAEVADIMSLVGNFGQTGAPTSPTVFHAGSLMASAIPWSSRRCRRSGD